MAEASRLAGRMGDYFERQIAWLESSREVLSEGASEDEETLERFIREHAARLSELRALESEFDALKKEWDAHAPVSESDHAVVQPLARKAEALSKELQQMYADRGTDTDAMRAEVADQLDGLRRARRNLRPFVNRDERGGDLVDRQA